MGKQQPTLTEVIAYADKANDPALTVAANSHLILKDVSVTNRSGGAIDLGILRSYSDAKWKMHTVDDSGGPSTLDVTTEAQSETDVVTLFTTDTDDGFLLQSKSKFSLARFNISQAETGAPVYVYNYFDGTDFTKAVPLLDTPDYTSVAATHLSFFAPHDWEVGGGLGTAAHFTIFAKATTAPATAVQVTTAIKLSEWLDFTPQVADDGSLNIAFNEQYSQQLDGGEGLLPYFGTANASNILGVSYSFAR